VAAAEASLAKRFDDRVSAGVSPPVSGDATPDGAEVFAVVTLSRNQTVKCSIGAELLLRIGTAAVVGETPGLVDSTDGATLPGGGDMLVNHLYMVTIEGNGLKATSDTVKVMIRGTYTVS
jgi:formylmethanofuran:tetrahydromethanopterin formyltransferase